MGRKARAEALLEIRTARRALSTKIAAKQSVRGWRKVQASRLGHVFYGNQHTAGRGGLSNRVRSGRGGRGTGRGLSRGTGRRIGRGAGRLSKLNMKKVRG